MTERRLDQVAEIDEHFIAEWLVWGFDAFNHLLTRHMQFLEYCLRHDLSDTEEGDDDGSTSP